jgi:hypothetical protein
MVMTLPVSPSRGPVADAKQKTRPGSTGAGLLEIIFFEIGQAACLISAAASMGSPMIWRSSIARSIARVTLPNLLDCTGRSMPFEAGGPYAPESFARLQDSAAVPAMSH